jgi:hypothetical protein
MTILVNCPSCRHVRQVPERDVCLGVMCPYCHGAYMDTSHRPLGEMEGKPAALSSSSYEVDVPRWFAYGAAHWTSILGPAIGFLIIQLVVTNVVSSLALIPIAGVFLYVIAAVTVLPLLEAGMYVVTLAQLKGDRWSFGDFFAGFSSRWRGRFLAFTWLLIGLMLVILTPVLVPLGIGLARNVPELLYFALVAFFIFGPVAVYVGVRLAFFGPYLIIDRNFGPVEAIQESWDLTTGHFWGLFGVVLLLAVINFGGALLFGVGALFTVPLTSLVRTAGYLFAGGTRPPMKQPERF